MQDNRSYALLRLVIQSELDFQSNLSVASGEGVGGLFTQQSTKNARKGAILDAAVCGGGGAKDCGDIICVVEKGWFAGNQQEYAKRFTRYGNQEQMLLGDLTMILVWPAN
eukprot:929667-Ditylum_brightwellii.AAC.1